MTEGRGGICGRTKQVVQEILSQLNKTDCSQVSPKQLQKITLLDLRRKSITSLKPGDFSGLSFLKWFYIGENSLKALPPGVFNKLSSLEQLGLDHGLLSIEDKTALQNKGIQIVE